MKEWFKARNIWGAAIRSLSDAEAGRLAKALWSYTMSGEEPNLSGAEKGIFAMIQMTLSQDENQANDISQKRATAGAEGAKQRRAKKANADFASEMQANEANANFASCEIANEAIGANKNKNKNKSKNKEKEIVKEKEPLKRFTPPTLEEVSAYCRERGNSVDPEKFIDFYASKGWKVGNQPMKDWQASIRTWERDDRRKAEASKPKQVTAQQYGQRDYSGADAEAMRVFLEMNGGQTE